MADGFPAIPAPDGRAAVQPIVEGLETRKLMSTATQSAEVQNVAETANSTQQHQATTDVVNSPADPEIRQLALRAQLAHADDPHPRELKRQIFTAAWIGQYTVGPPRFSDRASTIHAYAVSGGSNQFLKGKLNLVLFPPADPSATPTPGDPYANQVTGIAGLFPQDLLQSGSTARARPEQHPRPRLKPARAADPSDLDLRQQHKRGRLRRARSNSPRGPGRSRSSGSQMPTRSRARWVRER